MATNKPKRDASASSARSAPDLGRLIQSFIQQAGKPVLVETGVPALPLQLGSYSIEVRGESCLLEAWSDQANLVRRVTGVAKCSRTALELEIRKFGGKPGRLGIHDEGATRSAAAQEADRRAFQRNLQRLLEREYSGWAVPYVTAGTDLEHSLSSRYVRAELSRGHERWAVLACGRASGRDAAEEMLTPGLLWLDQVIQRAPSSVVRGLKLFVPRAWAARTASRLAWLRTGRQRFELWGISASGEVSQIPAREDGNLISQLRPCLPAAEPVGQAAEWCGRLRGIAPVEEVPCPDGLWSLRIRGVEFARVGRSVMVYGLDGREPVSPTSFEQVCTLARELARWRSPDAEDPSHPLYRLRPESWLESQIRRHPQLLDPALRPQPLYSQVAAVAGRERPIVDLLGVDRYRRLVVAEVKAEENMYLPLQAMDYWINARHHLRSRALADERYFPAGLEPDTDPRLFLVAPSLKFHPTTETVLRYFAPEIEVTRVGVSEEWRRELRVVLRLHGAERPEALKVKGSGA